MEQLLTTKLYIPPARPEFVPRPRLIERLNASLHRKLTLISAPAGFGKTTLVSEWVAGCERPVAWLSLDEGDNDPTRFLIYLVAALRTIAANIGAGVLGVLQAPQPPPIESILIALLNEITTVPDNFVLVLDDYHVIDSKPVDEALTFLLEHLPPQMHLVIATREDPHLPLARLRARSQLTDLRAADLRFTLSEAAGFLNQVMGLNLSAEEIAALEARTEGWIAGLQLAALSMQGRSDTADFIQAFTGSLPRPWERSLPAMKGNIPSPTSVQRDFGRIIRQFGSPAGAPKRRGYSPGRCKGKPCTHRERIPVVFKGKT